MTITHDYPECPTVEAAIENDFEIDIETAKEIFYRWRLTPVSVFAKKRKITRATAYNWIKSGKVKTVTIGTMKYIVDATK
jgi:hypothetical protein